MYATEQGILNSQMNTTLMEQENAILEEALIITSRTGAKIHKDGNQWCYILGNLPEPNCIVGFGDTPTKALFAYRDAFKAK